MNTTSTALAAGKEIISYCTRCKMDLAHMIMSMVGAVPARVLCKTCKSEHNFKPKKGVKEPGAAAPGGGSSTGTKRVAKPKAETVSVEVEWLKQLNASTRPLKVYAANEAFAAGDKISHPTFGEGIVQKLVYPNKIEIIFRTDIKMLIHAGKATI